VDELGAKHVSNHSYDWKYWEVLNEVDAGSSGKNTTHRRLSHFPSFIVLRRSPAWLPASHELLQTWSNERDKGASGILSRLQLASHDHG